MTVIVSQTIILAVGITVCVLSAWGLSAPDRLRKLVGGVMERDWGMYFAVGVRLVLGLALILAASQSRFPLTFTVLGAITLVAAVALPFVGRERIVRLLAWFGRLPPAAIRVWLLFGIAFGGFLVYGVL